MVFKKLLGLLLVPSILFATHTTGRKLNATDITNAAGSPVFRFPTALPTASRTCVMNADSEITSSSVTSTELGFLSGVTSSVQTQLGNKVDMSYLAFENLLDAAISGGQPDNAFMMWSTSGSYWRDRTPAQAATALGFTNTAVTPGSYTSTNLTVDSKGRITAASNGSGGTAPKYATIKDVKSNGSGGDSLTASTWNIRVLNTLQDANSIITSLSSNQFVLGAGTYQIWFQAQCSRCGTHQARLRNITDSSTAVVGSVAQSEDNGSVYIATESIGVGYVTISGATTFELQHYPGLPGSAGYGANLSGNGESAIYAQITITKTN